jgi:hypothetical protein
MLHKLDAMSGAMHQTCTRHAPDMHQTCTRHAPDMHQTCTRHAPDMHQTCTRHAPDMHQTCTRHAPDTHQTRTRAHGPESTQQSLGCCKLNLPAVHPMLTGHACLGHSGHCPALEAAADSTSAGHAAVLITQQPTHPFTAGTRAARRVLSLLSTSPPAANVPHVQGYLHAPLPLQTQVHVVLVHLVVHVVLVHLVVHVVLVHLVVHVVLVHLVVHDYMSSAQQPQPAHCSIQPPMLACVMSAAHSVCCRPAARTLPFPMCCSQPAVSGPGRALPAHQLPILVEEPVGGCTGVVHRPHD